MRSVKLVAVVALLAGSVAFGASQIVYTLELGGNNHADLWEANQSPSFTKGVLTDTSTVDQGQSITWAVRVSVGGYHDGDPGAGLVPYGAANLVFDLELYDSTGALVTGFGAAHLVAQGNQNVPDSGGFWSSINDGDTAGTRGGIAPDTLANAAFAIGIRNNDPDEAVNPDASGQMYSLADAAPNGPNFDYGWYPTANGRGGIDIGGTKPINTAVSGLDGKLVGFGAGYKSYDYTTYRPGVGVAYLTSGTDYGFGKSMDVAFPQDPLDPAIAAVERVVFEGQISTIGLPVGTYTLKVKPSADGNNILHGAVSWSNPVADYGGFGSFAAKANEVVPNDTRGNPGIKFQVTQPECVPSVAARKIFYNQSYYDGNKVAIDAAPIAGANNDDADAIDTSKSALISGTATFANWTGYDKGINGLIYDFNCPTRAPAVGDFTFLDIGKAGTAAGTAKTPSAFVVIPGTDTVPTRVIITFANGTIKSTWLKVTIGTGFGLAAADVHYWGNAVGDCNTGDAAPNILVNSTDEVGARNNPKTIFSRATVDFRYDYNKDSLVNSTDEVITRAPNTTTIHGKVDAVHFFN